MKHSTSFFIICSLAASPVALATDPQGGAEVEFSQVWRLIKSGAPALQATQHDLEAAQIGKDRAARHWYPRVFASGRVFSTNDAGTSFIYTLEQRQIGSADFAPSALNQPGSSWFEQGTLGLDLPLFEGGAKVAQAQAAEKAAEAKSEKLLKVGDGSQAAGASWRVDELPGTTTPFTYATPSSTLLISS